MAGIFISYRRVSSPTARLIGNYLREHFGRELVFIDTDSIDPGIDFRERLKESLDRCDVMLVIIDGEWLEGVKVEPAWVRHEIETAMGRKIPIIPILIDDTKMPSEDALPKTMANFFYYERAKLNTDSDFEQHMKRLMDAISRHIERAKAASTDEPTPTLQSGKQQADTRKEPVPQERSREPDTRDVEASHPSIAPADAPNGFRLGQMKQLLFLGFAVVLMIAVWALWNHYQPSPPPGPSPSPQPVDGQPPSGEPPSGGGNTLRPPVAPATGNTIAPR